MNRNPFVPVPSYSAPQPPLPPGPPPSVQPGQPDYSAWWAASAAQQPLQQQPGATQYNAQWTPPQPARPAHEQNALYANYGYGNQPGNWQKQPQQQPTQQYQPQAYHPAPAAPQPAQVQPGYNPYQPTAGYPQAYAPQAPAPPQPQPMNQPAYHPPAQPGQFFGPHIPQGPQQQRMHHAPAAHAPPAKRPRFDGPNNRPNQHIPPSQPHFQPPAAPLPAAPFPGTPGRTNPPSGPSQMMSGRGGGPARGGFQNNRGRGGSFTANRGGLAGRGRGGSVFLGPANSGRGGGPPSQPGGTLRGHGSRNNFSGPGVRRPTGPSFNAGSGFNRGGFKNRDGGSANRMGGRQDGGSGGGNSTSFSNKDAAATSGAGKKDENRRTLTDFKIVGLSIPELGWTWGMVPASQPKAEIKEEVNESDSSAAVKDEAMDDSSALHSDATGDNKNSLASETKPDTSEAEARASNSVLVAADDAKPLTEALAKPVSRYSFEVSNPPPSRLRIYFHTPVTADDAKPIPHNTSPPFEESRKGKRKKLEDDDGDLEEGRAPPPPPQMSGMNDDQSSKAASVAPSVAETTSEGDWLMAAIVEGEEGAEGAAGEEHAEGGDAREDNAEHNAHDDDDLGDLDAEGEVEALMDGAHDDDHDTDMAGDDVLTGIQETQVPDMTAAPHASAEEQNGRSTGAVADAPDMSPDGHLNGIVNGTEKEYAELPLSSEASTNPSLDTQSPRGADIPEPAIPFTNPPDSLAAQVQVPTTNGTVRSLEDASVEPTLLVIESQEATQMDEDTQVASHLFDELNNGRDAADAASSEATASVRDEPPISPASNTNEDAATSKIGSKGPPVPSANRLSISYAGGNCRFVINAESVSSLKLYRHDARVEIALDLSENGEHGLKGVLAEHLSESKTYVPIPDILDGDIDPAFPPFCKLTLPTSVQLVVHLDTARPLSEPKWARSGDVQEWLKSMFGRMFWVAGDAAEGWEKKIHVVDPDPPPTIWTFLDGWASNSPAGSTTERQRFLKTHMTETDNILEILLRLVRGERATPFSHNPPQMTQASLSGPLLSALTPGSAHGAQQTHVSLAVLAIFRQTMEYAKKALGDEKGKKDAEDKVGDIIRCLPSHLIYKSLDGIFKEWRMEKKGAGRQ